MDFKDRIRKIATREQIRAVATLLGIDHERVSVQPVEGNFPLIRVEGLVFHDWMNWYPTLYRAGFKLQREV